jgi:hypothetical protein
MDGFYGSPFPFPPWLSLVLLVAVSPFILLWAVLGTDAVFYQSTGEYRDPTFLQATRGVFISLLPAMIWIAFFFRTIKRIRQAKKPQRTDHIRTPLQ